jgi:hypothetical protein
MDIAEDKGYGWDTPIQRPDGVTHAERYLKKLCDRSFLSLWSHAGIYRDQGKVGKGDGKEVSDLLVVFENHIIIFSDKDCKFPETGDLALDWSRWYRRAVEEAAKQILGAEKWIKQYPDRLYLDRACTHRFPIDLPLPDKAKFHRVIVAHGASERCRRVLGGSGSLMVIPAIIGEAHRDRDQQHFTPFAIGQVDPTKGYVHVFDDTTLDVVMRTRDTITDFVDYLSSKESFIESGRLAWATGEEELLALFLSNINDEGEHDFVVPPGRDPVTIGPGLWEHFLRSPERKAQVQADAVSYVWDNLIESVCRDFYDCSLYFSTHPTYSAQEKVFRFFARESRFRRRMLARSFLEYLEKAPKNDRGTRVHLPMRPGYPYYVFLTLPHPSDVPDDRYREVRSGMLQAYCKVTRLVFPEARDILGIATEPGLSIGRRSKDFIYLDGTVWSDEDEAEARETQRRFGWLTEAVPQKSREYEYPVASARSELLPGRTLHRPEPRSMRNHPCPCGSGVKYKRCCGRLN